MTDFNLDELLAHIDLKAKLALSDNDSARLFHGRGGCFGGWRWINVDLHSGVLVASVFQDHSTEDQVVEAVKRGLVHLAERLQIALLWQQRLPQQALNQWLVGESPEVWYARRRQARFILKAENQQNLGYFLDMEPGRRWLEQVISLRQQQGLRCRVLNLFAYTCALSVVAQIAGAESVTNVDMSRSVLNRGRDNHRVNDLSCDTIEFHKLDILKSWGRLKRQGPFDIIIVDPPSFQKGSFVAQKDYQKLVRRLAELSAPQADILACLNAPEIGFEFVAQLFALNWPSAELVQTLAQSEQFPQIDPAAGLKLLHYRAPIELNL